MSILYDEQLVWRIGGQDVGRRGDIWMANPGADEYKAKGGALRFRVISGPANGN